MTPVLTLDAAGDGCAAGLAAGGTVLAERVHGGGHGSAAALPALVEAVLRDAGLTLSAVSAIAVTTGPGSFTGIRAALALAHGLALGTGLPLRGALATAAVRASCPVSRLGGHPVWVAVAGRRGRVFLDPGAGLLSLAIEELAAPPGPVSVAGAAAAAVLPWLGPDATLVPVTRPTPAGIAAAPSVPPVPAYLDAPQARPGPAHRPAPA